MKPQLGTGHGRSEYSPAERVLRGLAYAIVDEVGGVDGATQVR